MRSKKPRTEKQIAKEVARQFREDARDKARIKKLKDEAKAEARRAELKAKKAAKAKVDGKIGPSEIERIRKSLREAWMWTSLARRICIARATDKDGFGTCENKKCKKFVPKLFADHIEVMGSVLAPDYIVRLWCHSSKLQALCKKCHDKKTKEEKEAAQIEAVKTDIADFF